MDETTLRAKMQTAFDALAKDVNAIRTGRVTPSMVDEIIVPAYGGTQNLKVKELATINISDPQTLVISPWDKSIIGDIRKGLLTADIGVNPSIDGEIIRISVPPMTGEDRERHVKILNSKLENGKIIVRQLRGDTLKDIKKAFEEKNITEDEKFKNEKDLQTITDEFIAKIDELGHRKQEEIMTL